MDKGIVEKVCETKVLLTYQKKKIPVHKEGY